jgi:signal peptidase II
VNPRFRAYLAVALALLALDQAVKAWARGTFAIGEAMPIWPGVFELTLTYNRGIAFGLFSGAGVFFAPIGVAITAFTAWYSLRHPREPLLIHVGLALMASGAVGNLIDRLWLGKVTDMFWLRAINFPVFNVADSCITVAAVLLAFVWLRAPARPAPETRPRLEE